MIEGWAEITFVVHGEWIETEMEDQPLEALMRVREIVHDLRTDPDLASWQVKARLHTCDMGTDTCDCDREFVVKEYEGLKLDF